ncbi:hypothetical protein [Halorhodospira halophila]|uniref:hypothetical protein n=1 Tax=Halorhodospira halophila TaxID=1053 RepID=UPI0019127D4C|nr:hypothetical protein [Halorhodospira halophila]MBK5935785.1 hypothetical protein [Halorhodospira halophila]
MNFLLDSEAIADLAASRGQARAHLEALVAHEPPYGVAYRRLQAICAHRRDANTVLWRWVVDETGGERVIREIEAGAEIEDVHASIRDQLAEAMSSRGEPADAPIRYARIPDLFLRHLASCEILSEQSRSRLVWEAPVALEAEVLAYLRRFVPALILGQVDGDVVDRQAAYDDLQRLVREITVRAGVPNLYFAAMAEIEAPDAVRS